MLEYEYGKHVHLCTTCMADTEVLQVLKVAYPLL